MSLLALRAPVLAASAQVDIPPECGSQEEFEGEVRRRLPNDEVLGKTRIVLERDAAGPWLHVRVGREVRSLRDADCRALVQAAVVVTVAIALSETAPRRGEPASAEPASAEPASAEPALPERERDAGSAPSQRMPFGFSAGLGGGVSFGLLPRPVLALELEARAEGKLLGAFVDLRYLAAGEVTDELRRGVSVGALGIAAGASVRPHETLELRIGAVLYRLLGTGLGSWADQDDAAWAAGPMAGVAYTPLQLAGFRLGVGVEAHLEVIRPEFEILNYGRVYGVPRFGGAALIRFSRIFF